MGQLCKEHAHHVTPGTESSCHRSHPQSRVQVSRLNAVESDCKVAPGHSVWMRLVWCFFLSPLPSGRVKDPCQPLFFCSLAKTPMRWQCQIFVVKKALQVRFLSPASTNATLSPCKKRI